MLAVINRHRFLFLVQETPTFALQVMSAMASQAAVRRLNYALSDVTITVPRLLTWADTGCDDLGGCL